MSYSRKTCRTYFSPQQYARIAFAAANLRSYLTCSSGGGGTGLINGCAGASQYPTTTFTPTTTWQTASTNIYAGEYSVYNVVAGTTYDWSLCATDGGSASYNSELTLTDINGNELAYNDDFCSTQSKISWTSTITGMVWVHVTENHCQTNSTNTTLVYREGSPGSPNLDKLTDNITISGNNVTVSTTIENNGTGVSGAFSVRFYASINNIISTGDTEIHTEVISSLAASTNTSINQTIDLCTLPTLTNNSTYYIGYIIDYANTVVESDETDNTWAWGTSPITLNCVTGCISTSQYPSTTFTPSTTWQTAASNIYAGEYSVYNVVAGTTYEWSLCATDGGSVTYDSEMTLTDASNSILDYNNDFCGTDSKITWVSTITGTVRVHISEYQCQTNSTSTTLVYKQQQVTGCISTSQYPSTTFTPSTTWQTAASNIYAGEYSVYNVVAGTTYEWSLCATDGGSVTYDSEMTLTDASNSILDYNNDFCGTDSKITWVSTITGTVRVHISEYQCQTNSTNTTLVYKQQAASTLPNLTSINTTSISMNTNTATISFDMENNGSAAAGAFDVRFYASTNNIISTGDVEIAVETYTGLAANTSNSKTVVVDLCNITGFSPSGNYYIGFLIDEPSQVIESDENDNNSYFTNPVNINCTVIPTYTVTTSENPSTAGATTGGGTFNSGQTVTLIATANTGWNFDGWSENGSTVSTNPTYTFSVTANHNLIAEFSQQIIDITTSSTPAIGGTTSGGGNVPYNQSVTVVATSNTGWIFDSWTENGAIVSTIEIYTFNAVMHRNLVAVFTQQQFTITTNSNPMTGGNATGGGTFNFNQDATLTATPTVGWNFDGWSENGNIVSTNVLYVFSVFSDRNLIAEFSQQEFSITVDADSLQGGSVSGGGTFNYKQP